MGVRQRNEGGGERAARVAAAAMTAAVAAYFGVDAAWASSDTTFSGPLDTVSDMVAGTGGQLAAALAVGAALVGSVLRFNARRTCHRTADGHCDCGILCAEDVRVLLPLQAAPLQDRRSGSAASSRRRPPSGDLR